MSQELDRFFAQADEVVRKIRDSQRYRIMWQRAGGTTHAAVVASDDGPWENFQYVEPPPLPPMPNRKLSRLDRKLIEAIKERDAPHQSKNKRD